MASKLQYEFTATDTNSLKPFYELLTKYQNQLVYVWIS